MKEKIAIVSLRFNPAFIQFLIAYSKAVTELGHEVEFLLDPAYRRFPELVDAAPIVKPGESPLVSSWTNAIFLNTSAENRQLAIALKQKGTKILYVFHEPWQMSLSYLRSEGLTATSKAIVAHHVTAGMLKVADTVLLASQYGLNEYQKSDARFNRNAVCFPLIFDDEAPGDIGDLLRHKRYFGYLGSLGRSHGFDLYLSFIRHAFLHDLNFRFLIASRNSLPESILKDPVFRKNLDKIEVRCGRPLDNASMNRCYAESFCVWNLYRRTTQSAVLPKAFMFGTPVIATPIGSFPEYIQEGVNGRFAGSQDHQGISDAVKDMRDNIGRYAANCRRTFLEAFYYRVHLADLGRLLDSGRGPD